MLAYIHEETGVTLTVKFDRYDSLQHERMRWHYSVAVGHEVIDEGDDLTTMPTGNTSPELQALEALVCFAEAFVESFGHQQRTGSGNSHNAGLFPAKAYAALAGGVLDDCRANVVGFEEDE